MKKKKRSYRLLYPVVIWMTCFFLIPVALMVLVSFFTRGEFGEVIYSFNVESYIRFMDPLYLNILLKSLIIALFTTVICLVFAYPFAFFIGRSPKKFRGPLIMLVMLPFWTNSLIRTYAWIILLRTEGIINS